MKQQFDKSFEGVPPDPKTTIPSFLTPQKTIEILKKIMNESALRLNNKFLELLEKGENLSFNNPKMAEIMSKIKMDNGKNEILELYGLNNFEDSGSQILQYATQVYADGNQEGFNEQIKAIEIKFSTLMEKIMMNGPMQKDEFAAYVEKEFTSDVDDISKYKLKSRFKHRFIKKKTLRLDQIKKKKKNEKQTYKQKNDKQKNEFTTFYKT